MTPSPETLLTMNQRLIAIYEKKPLNIHISKMTKSQIRRERDKFLTELRNEKLKKQLEISFRGFVSGCEAWALSGRAACTKPLLYAGTDYLVKTLN